MKDQEEFKRVIKEMETDALTKLNQIKQNILTATYSSPMEQIQILAMVNDELSDVILNWDPKIIGSDLGEDFY